MPSTTKSVPRPNTNALLNAPRMPSTPYVSGFRRMHELQRPSANPARETARSKKEQRHHDEIHDQLKSLHVLQHRADGRADAR